MGEINPYDAIYSVSLKKYVKLQKVKTLFTCIFKVRHLKVRQTET